MARLHRRLVSAVLSAALLAGGPGAALAADAQPDAAQSSVGKTIASLKARIAQVRHKIALARDYDDIENVQSAYGYYVDKNLFAQEADLYAKGATMEMAQRGVYVGADSIRRFHAADRPGPSENRLLDHPQLQPVIHVAPDGKTAKVRAIMWQMMGQAGGRGTIGSGVYENEMVKEDGVWKIGTLHTYNTYVFPYDGGPTKAAPAMPGPSATVPPDRPASFAFEGFPTVYEIPYHYKNPVTGR